MRDLTWGKGLERISSWPPVAHLLEARSSARTRLLLAVIPPLIVFWVGACFVWNHFLRGPYLLDSGWYSSIIYQQGLLPDNPRSAHSIREYYGIHFSPLVSVASIVSYALPIGRVPYYCLFQGLIYAPLGAVTGLLARHSGADSTAWGALKVLVAALLFAFNGQAMACLGYPHYEIFLSAGLCILLVGFATGRVALAWLGVAIAACTREDGGLHSTAFCVAGILCSFTGRPFPLQRAALVKMALASGLASFAAFTIQKVGFHSASLFRHEYLGDPAYAHLSLEVIRRRLAALPDDANFILLGLAGTTAVAVVARDWRYLLGWVVELPWLFVNFFAAQELKAHFSIYTGFPFVASIFWIGAYGQIGRSILGARRWLGALAIVSAMSTYGLYYSRPVPFRYLLEFSSTPADIPYGELAEFAWELEQNPDVYGAILADPGITAWAVRTMPPERSVGDVQRVVSPQSFDGIAFFKHGRLAQHIQRFVDKSGFSRCGNIAGTDVFMCVRPERELPRMFRQTPPAA